MRECSSVIEVHSVRAGVKRGGRAPFGIGEVPTPSPCNCKTPCCYGKGRCYCWPCMKNIMAGHNAAKKGIRLAIAD